MSNNVPVPDDRQHEIANACRLGMTGREAAKRYGVSPSSVSNILRRFNIKPPIGRRPTCEIDHSAFDVITPEVAYWMGFLFADGSIQPQGGGAPAIVIGLARKDKGHLEKFRAFLKSTHSIGEHLVTSNLPNQTTSAPRQAARISVRSRQLVAVLRRVGMTEKGIDRAPTKELRDSFDFWRGAIDGDGTVHVIHDKRHDYFYALLILCGHTPLLDEYQKFLKRHGIAANITPTDSGIFQIRIFGANAMKMIESMWTNPCVVLDRKNADAQDILARRQQLTICLKR